MQRLLLLFLTALLVVSCKKGTDIEYPSFGKLAISGTAAEGEMLLPVQVDGATVDTLKRSENGAVSLSLILQAGERHLTIGQPGAHQLLDTILNINAGTTATLPQFLYLNGVLLFDDPNPPQPTEGAVKVRFISLDPNLPDLINISVGYSYLDFNTFLYSFVPVHEIKNVRKDAFSEYVELVPVEALPIDPNLGMAEFYYIEGYDAETGEKIMSLENNTMGYLACPPTGSVVPEPNYTFSMGIGPVADPSVPTRRGQLIFHKAF